MKITKGYRSEFYTTVIAITKLGTIEIGYRGYDDLFHTTHGRTYNIKDVLAFHDLTEIESEMRTVFENYCNQSNNLK